MKELEQYIFKELQKLFKELDKINKDFAQVEIVKLLGDTNE